MRRVLLFVVAAVLAGACGTVLQLEPDPGGDGDAGPNADGGPVASGDGSATVGRLMYIVEPPLAQLVEDEMVKVVITVVRPPGDSSEVTLEPIQLPGLPITPLKIVSKDATFTFFVGENDQAAPFAQAIPIRLTSGSADST